MLKLQAYILNQGSSSTCPIAFGNDIKLLISIIMLVEAHSSMLINIYTFPKVIH